MESLGNLLVVKLIAHDYFGNNFVVLSLLSKNRRNTRNVMVYLTVIFSMPF